MDSSADILALLIGKVPLCSKRNMAGQIALRNYRNPKSGNRKYLKKTKFTPQASTPNSLKKTQTIGKILEKRYFSTVFSIICVFCKESLGSGLGGSFLGFFEGCRGSGFLDPCSWPCVSQE